MDNIINGRPDKLHVKHNYTAQFPFSELIHNWCNARRLVNTLNIREIDDSLYDQAKNSIDQIIEPASLKAV